MTERTEREKHSFVRQHRTGKVSTYLTKSEYAEFMQACEDYDVTAALLARRAIQRLLRDRKFADGNDKYGKTLMGSVLEREKIVR